MTRARRLTCVAAAFVAAALESSTVSADSNRIRVGTRYGVLFGDAGMGVHAGLSVGVTIHPLVSIGATFHTLFAAANTEGDCWYGHRCTTTFTQAGPYVEGRLYSEGIVNPWARLALGVGNRGAPKLEPFGKGAFAASLAVDVGVAFRVWRVSIGPYLTGIVLTRSEATKGAGIQVGFEF